MKDATFVFDGSDLALDFLNTGAGASAGSDGLASPGSVTAWLEAAGLLAPEEAASLTAAPPQARLLRDEALLLRDTLYRLVAAFHRGAPLPREGVDALNRALASAYAYRQVSTAGTELLLSDVHVAKGPLGRLAPVAAAAAELLAGADPRRVRRCADPTCPRWFRDTSKNGSRRWCSMARCGNRAKVAAHSRRRREADGGAA